MNLIILKYLEENIFTLGITIDESKCKKSECILSYEKRLKHLDSINKVDDLRYQQIKSLLFNLNVYKHEHFYSYFIKSESSLGVFIYLDNTKTKMLGLLEFEKWSNNGNG